MVEERMAKEEFCPLSLRDWLRVCRECEVPFVPATHVADLETNDVKSFETKGPHQTRIEQAFKKINRAQSEGYMLRWDHCSEARIKVGMADKEFEWREEYGDITLGDIRAFDLLFDYPYFVNPIWQRPWVQVEIIEGFPVEYRVFVENGELKGISNYYLQRPLPENKAHIAEITYYTDVLIHWLRKLDFVLPVRQQKEADIEKLKTLSKGKKAKREKSELDDISFAADFLVLREGYTPPFFVSHDADQIDRRVLFLEGGPPFSSGLADPCCFNPEEGISGVAWEDRSGRRSQIEEQKEWVKNLGQGEE